MNPEDLRLHTPAVYIIRVVGFLDQRWSGYFGGLTMTTEPTGEDDRPITTITGQMADQAALLGLINALYDYHYPLLSVDCQICEQL
jgi:hypothetical protein